MDSEEVKFKFDSKNQHLQIPPSSFILKKKPFINTNEIFCIFQKNKQYYYNKKIITKNDDVS